MTLERQTLKFSKGYAVQTEKRTGVVEKPCMGVKPTLLTNLASEPRFITHQGITRWAKAFLTRSRDAEKGKFKDHKKGAAVGF